MRSSLRLFLLLPLTAMLACGSSSPSASAGLFPPPSGDWVLNVAPQTSSAGYFYGSLGTTGASSVAGVLHYYNPGTVCVPVTQDIPFTGTINAAGTTMTLATSAFAGSVATFSFQLPLVSSSTPNFANGTVTIAGGSCALPASKALADYINYFTTFTGNLTGSATGTVMLSVPQTSADADGVFLVSNASISFASPTCNFSALNLSGTVSGYSLQLSSATLTVSANTASSPFSLTVTGSCGGTLSGTVQ